MDAEARGRYAGCCDAGGSTVEIRDEDGWLRLLRGVSPPSVLGRSGSETQRREPSTVCRPALAPPYPSVDLIPLGDVVTFGRDAATGIRRLRVLEVYGWTYELERPDP